MAPRKKKSPKKRKVPQKKKPPQKRKPPQKSPAPDLGKTKWQDLLESPTQERSWFDLMHKHEPLKREQQRNFACIVHTSQEGPQNNAIINQPPLRLVSTHGRAWEEYDRDPYHIELSKAAATLSALRFDSDNGESAFSCQFITKCFPHTTKFCEIRTKR